MPSMAIYSASKHAIEGYSESLDHELRTQGIRVSIVEPAYTRTQFESNALQPDSKLAEYSGVRAALAKRLKELIEGGDSPAVVAEVVLKAATAVYPRPRYQSGGKAKTLSLLRRFAPHRLMDAGIRKDLQLDVPSASPSYSSAAGTKR